MRLLLSCISTKHSVLKQHWTESSQQAQCPLTVLGSYQKPQHDLGQGEIRPDIHVSG